MIEFLLPDLEMLELLRLGVKIHGILACTFDFTILTIGEMTCLAIRLMLHLLSLLQCHCSASALGAQH
jgi:hypothetical protein